MEIPRKIWNTEKVFVKWKYGVLLNEKYKKMEKMSVFVILQMFYNIEILRKYGENDRIWNYENTEFYNIDACRVTFTRPISFGNTWRIPSIL